MANNISGREKADKGCLLPLHVPELRILSDPSHRVHILLRPEIQWPSLFAVTFKSSLRLKISYYGVWIKKNRNLSLSEVTESSKAPINHLFGCHDYCSETWCPVKAGKM